MPKFDNKGACYLKDQDGNDVILLRKTWQLKLKYPERRWLTYNFDLLKSTVRSPDKIRPSSKNPNAEIYYKKCERICINPGITIPSPSNYMAVVIEKKRGNKIIKTFYPTNRIKK